MTDSKKRLEEIINNITHHKGSMLEPVDRKIANQILKEFVHKDNLPSESEILNCFIIKLSSDFKIAKAIRKLIEGKK